METFSALLAICAENSPVTGEFPTQRPVTRSFDVYFDLRLIERLSKQSWGWWFETLSSPLWRHRNVNCNYNRIIGGHCVITQVTVRWQCWAWMVNMAATHENTWITSSFEGPKSFLSPVKRIRYYKICNGFQIMVMFSTKLHFSFAEIFWLVNFFWKLRFQSTATFAVRTDNQLRR